MHMLYIVQADKLADHVEITSFAQARLEQDFLAQFSAGNRDQVCVMFIPSLWVFGLQ